MKHTSVITGYRILFYGVLFLVVVTGIISCNHKQEDKTALDTHSGMDSIPEVYRRVSIGDSLTGLSFEVPEQTETSVMNTSALDGVQWLDVRFPRYRATIYCSHHPLRNNLEQLNCEIQELVYRQSVHPDLVQAIAYDDTVRNIYATFYNLTAKSATPLQFVVTDSTRYLLRGALSFDNPGRSDSIAPVIDDFSNYIFHLIESIESPVR